MKKYFILGALLMFILTGNAYSQSPSDPSSDASKELQMKTERKEIPANFIANNSSTASRRSDFLNQLSDVSIASEFKDAKASAALKYSNGFNTGGISVEQTIKPGDQEATPFNLDGLAAGTTVNFGYQAIFWKKSSRKNFSYFDAARNFYAKTQHITDQSAIDAITYNQFKDDTKTLEKLNHKVHLSVPIFLNASYSFTKSSFDFTTDSIKLTSQTANKITHSAKLILGISLPVQRNSLSHFISFGFNFSTSYKNGSKMTFSSPFGGSGNYYSHDAIFGAPQLQINEKLSLEYGAAINLSPSFQIFLDPTVTVAINTEKMSFQIPVYFKNGKQDSKQVFKGFQGGFRLGYMTSLKSASSFKDGFGAELILAVPFDFFGNLKI